MLFRSDPNLSGDNSNPNVPSDNEEQPDGIIDKINFKIWQHTQVYVDYYSIYPKSRWFAAFLLLLIYIYRAFINDGIFHYYIGLHVISYFLGLYMLDKFLGFISPKDEDDVMLPVRQSDEFKPFRRAIKELDLW